MSENVTDVPVAFVPQEAHRLEGRLGFCPAPGRWRSDEEPDRLLRGDLRSLCGCGTSILVNLLEPEEMDRIGLSSLIESARSEGLEVLSFPIPDGSAPPDFQATSRLVWIILDHLAAGRTVVIHCHGGIGRSGTIAALCLVARGAEPSQALEVVRHLRPMAATAPGQEEFVYEFAERTSHATTEYGMGHPR